jgi:hypothetical protein
MYAFGLATFGFLMPLLSQAETLTSTYSDKAAAVADGWTFSNNPNSVIMGGANEIDDLVAPNIGCDGSHVNFHLQNVPPYNTSPKNEEAWMTASKTFDNAGEITLSYGDCWAHTPVGDGVFVLLNSQQISYAANNEFKTISFSVRAGDVLQIYEKLGIAEIRSLTFTLSSDPTSAPSFNPTPATSAPRVCPVEKISGWPGCSSGSGQDYAMNQYIDQCWSCDLYIESITNAYTCLGDFSQTPTNDGCRAAIEV